MNLVQQFQNLVDPSTTLGAFLISLIASIVVSFLFGMKFQRKIDKKNNIEVEKVDSIHQDIHKKSASDSESEKVRKSNSIKAGIVTGTIKQDVEE